MLPRQHTLSQGSSSVLPSRRLGLVSELISWPGGYRGMRIIYQQPGQPGRINTGHDVRVWLSEAPSQHLSVVEQP